ncbi:MAG: hypothetical protein LAO09_12045 [Acidobacteriia bacterium]|nr:hypothetical protein [Terriglobia bacterium]
MKHTTTKEISELISELRRTLAQLQKAEKVRNAAKKKLEAASWEVTRLEGQAKAMAKAAGK